MACEYCPGCFHGLHQRFRDEFSCPGRGAPCKAGRRPENEDREMTMLPSQREHFDVPRDICYLNAASWSPLPRKTLGAGRAAVARKGQPWKLSAGFANEQYERTRAAAAGLINADPDD